MARPVGSRRISRTPPRTGPRQSASSTPRIVGDPGPTRQDWEAEGDAAGGEGVIAPRLRPAGPHERASCASSARRRFSAGRG